MSPQYHVLFNVTFTTVESVPENRKPTSFWKEIAIESQTHRVPLEHNLDVEKRRRLVNP